jgi:hypothetical protein
MHPAPLEYVLAKISCQSTIGVKHSPPDLDVKPQSVLRISEYRTKYLEVSYVSVVCFALF